MNQQAHIEQRLACLEREVAQLKTALANGGQVKDWRRTIGMFTDDPGMQDLFKEALKIREADRKKARRRQKQRRRAKP